GDPFGGPGAGSFGGQPEHPGAYGSAGRPEPADHTSAFTPQQSGTPWSPSSPATEPEQGRFDAFKPVAEPAPDAPAPKVRNGRVLAAVLVAAVLILAIPLGLLLLLGKVGGSDEAGTFNPAVGSCVKRSGDSAVVAECGEPETFTVVSKVDSKDKCPDPSLPVVELRGNVAEPVLCLKDATG
ncbi:LppU/SCO3897 family protein, partial [Micromonospora qiuiae]|uniref:LppU/SCO3897 family protein n=1 Tax=Micromonospora qiuiae TaxID=502268 RepID=UPI003FD6D630